MLSKKTDHSSFNGKISIYNLKVHYMLVQQLKQLQDKLKKLKSQQIISKEDAKEIRKIEKWFEEFNKAE